MEADKVKKTKIICTMGPNADNEETLRALIENGMDVARFNFSHGDYEEQKARMDLLKRVRKEMHRPIAILLDTKGPEIRTGVLENGGKVLLREGEEFTLTATEMAGTEKKVYQTYPQLSKDVKPGDTILIDDGLIGLKVKEIQGKDIVCRVVNGGELGQRKGINVPNVSVNLPGITAKDKKDIIFGIEQGIDFIAASFVRNADAVREIRTILKEHNAEHIEIISKIENSEGIENLDKIIQASDGIMVARGDMGVEIPAYEVPHVQKMIVEKCNQKYKPVIIATQMLDSMIRNPRPTRAEVTDVANAIREGTDAIMLSGETAQGDYPVEAVSTMNRIAQRIESSLEYKALFVERGIEHMQSRTRAVAHATVQMAWELDVPAIITPTDSGYTTKVVSRYRPKAAIVAYTPHDKVVRQLNLRWGVYPILGTPWKDVDEMIANAASAAVKQGYVKRGDTTIITSGIKLQSKTSVGNNTNMIRVYQV